MIETRLPVCLAAICLVLALCTLAWSTAVRPEEPIRIGLSPVFLDDRASLLETWARYLEQRLGRAVQFLQRARYREMTYLLEQGGLEFAWICSNPYLQHESRLSPVAVPLFQGSPLYRSYVIVSAFDPETRVLADLEDKVFAFSDPDSTTGHLAIRDALAQAGVDPKRYFRKSFFTYGHRNVIRAVAEGLAHGGAVASYVWETLARTDPQLTGATRVIWTSQTFGASPIVAGRFTPETLRQQLAETLQAMDEEAEGRDILVRLNLDGFAPPRPDLYDAVRRLRAAVIGDERRSP